VRDGEGPQDLPINRTAASAGAVDGARDPAFVLEIVVGDRVVTLDRDQLLAMPQRTHRLPIACVEGWSRSASWTGVSVRDLIGLLDAPADSEVVVRSLQTKGAFASSKLLPGYVEDHRTMLALQLNGETLSLDHGYPCRLIAPNRPGVFQTKWVRRLEVTR
ncbi:MAG: molybdopterin-dependent oxidoreductase, partial [Aeromicrobium sp.]